MELSLDELATSTDRLAAAIQRGRPIVLTASGRAIADIVPRRRRSERRATPLVIEDLREISRQARRLALEPDSGDHETGHSTADL